MKTKISSQVRLGATLAGLTLLLFVMVFSLDSVVSYWRGSCPVKVTFQHVQGLRVNDPVHFHGVPCGRVTALRIGEGVDEAVAHASEVPSSFGGAAVTVTLSVPGNVFERLRARSTASISKTLTGMTVVDLEQGEGEPLSKGGQIQAREATTLNQVTAQLHASSRALTGILEKVEVLVREIRDDDLVVGTLREVRATSQELSGLAQEMRQLTEENRPALKELSQRSVELLGELGVSVREMPGALDELREVARTSGDFLGSLRTWFRHQKAPIQATVEDLSETAAGLETFVSEIRRRPWRLLHTPSDDEMLGIELYESGTAYARGAVELRRALEEVGRLLDVHGEDPDLEEPLRAALEDLESRTRKFKGFEDAFWQSLERLSD